MTSHYSVSVKFSGQGRGRKERSGTGRRKCIGWTQIYFQRHYYDRSSMHNGDLELWVGFSSSMFWSCRRPPSTPPFVFRHTFRLQSDLHFAYDLTVYFAYDLTVRFAFNLTLRFVYGVFWQSVKTVKSFFFQMVAHNWLKWANRIFFRHGRYSSSQQITIMNVCRVSGLKLIGNLQQVPRLEVAENQESTTKACSTKKLTATKHQVFVRCWRE